MQQRIQQTYRNVFQQHAARRGAAIRTGGGCLSEDFLKDGGRSETPTADTYLLRVGPELWSAVIRESPSPAEDTRAALQAIRGALEAVRRLRFAGGLAEDEQRRLADLAAAAIHRQEHALRLWSAGRGSDTAPAQMAGDQRRSARDGQGGK